MNLRSHARSSRAALGLAAALSLLCAFATGCHHAEKAPPVPRSETPPIVIDDAFSERNIGLNLDFLEDKTRALTAQDVRGTAHAPQFVPSTKASPNFGYTKSVWWARFSLDDQRTSAQHGSTDRLALTLGYAQTDLAELTCEAANGTQVVQSRAGDHVPFAEWPNTYREPTFFVPAAARTCFLRIDSGASVQFPLTLRTRETFAAHRLNDTAAQGLYFGALLVMAVYNGLVAAATRSASYACYTLFLLAFGLCQCALGGFGYAVLWPGASGFADRAMPLGVVGGMLTSIQFAVLLLGLPRSSPRLWTLARVTLSLCAIHACGMWLVPYSVAIRWIIALAPLWAVVLLASGVSQSRRGSRVAKLFLASWTVFIVGTLIVAAKSLAFLPSNAFTVNANQVGSAIEFVLLSFALADRIKTLQAEVIAQAEIAREASENARRASEGRAELEARAAQELRRLAALKDAFLANTSHELRTPLNGVIGMAEALGASAKLPPELRGHVVEILGASRSLSDIVGRILDFGKASEPDADGEQARTPDSVELFPIVTEAAAELRARIGQRPIELKLTLPPATATILGWEHEVTQVLRAIFSNAEKFSEFGRIELVARRVGSCVEIVITDEGLGIAKADLPTIFTPFQQGDGSASRKYAGTGIGLALVKKLTEQMGGTVSIDSALGAGTSVALLFHAAEASGAIFTDQAARASRARMTPFAAMAPVASAGRIDLLTQYVPVANAPTYSKLLVATAAPIPVSAARSQVPTFYGGRQPRAASILVVDDDRLNRLVVTEHLQNGAFKVVEAGSGAEALERFENEGPFDLVLLDVMMPGMSGYDVCRTLRQAVSAADVPVLLLTAKNQVEDIVEGFSAGANDFVHKPITRGELLARLHTHLRVARASVAMRRFIPQETIRLLGHEDMTEVCLGDAVEQHLTISFSDVRGFTTKAEMLSPADTFEWLNRCFGIIGPIIRTHSGFVDKYIGDALLAIFPMSPVAAVEAAIAMHHALDGLNDMHIGTGIHVGRTRLGTLGEPERFEATVLSDAVNIASRVEGASKFFGARVLVTETVRKAAQDEPFTWRALGDVRLKGRRAPIKLFELLDAEPPAAQRKKRESLEEFHYAVEAFKEGRMNEAQMRFESVASMHPEDATAHAYIEHIALCLRTGDVDPDGVFVLHEK